jgi:hypothetical protein
MSLNVVSCRQIHPDLARLVQTRVLPVDDGQALAGGRRYGGPVRWDALFADLEAQFETEQAAGLAAEVADLTRAEVASVTLADRLHAQVGRELVWWTVDGERLAGVVAEAGADWVLVGAARQERLLPLAAVAAVSGLSRQAEPVPAGSGRRRLPLTVLLRRLARDREPVELQLCGGRQYLGTVDRVAADHLDLAVRRSDEQLRDAADRLTVPLTALLQIRLPRPD